MKQHTQQFLRKRKLMVFLPILALPITTLLFWSLKASGANTESNKTTLQGLNTQLPGAQLDSQQNDKLSLYQQALKDSAQLAQERQQDPYSLAPDTEKESVYADADEYSGGYAAADPDRNVRKVQERLDALQQSLRSPSELPDYQSYAYAASSDDGPDMAKLHNAMQQIQEMQSGSAADPDIDKINGMLQKVIDIQHPEQAKERLEAQSYKNKGIVYSISEPKEHTVADLLAPFNNAGYSPDSAAAIQPGRAAFYEMNDDTKQSPEDNKATPAVVNESQTLVNGATLKMRLTEDIFINGVHIPKGSFVFGSCNLQGERLMVSISSIRYGKKLFPVALSVYDLDGLEGIRIPGAITRDAAKEGANQGIQSLNLMTMDPSLGAQAAAAGIEATKSLLGKKVKLVRVTVKAGYPVLLYDENKRSKNQ